MNREISQIQPQFIFLNQGSIDFETGIELCPLERFNHLPQPHEIRLIEKTLEEGDLVQLKEGLFILDLDLMAQPHKIKSAHSATLAASSTDQPLR
ncbi:MAG: hypothetical protein AB4038_11125 [Prochloraceae cyanobacterium]